MSEKKVQIVYLTKEQEKIIIEKCLDEIEKAIIEGEKTFEKPEKSLIELLLKGECGNDDN